MRQSRGRKDGTNYAVKAHFIPHLYRSLLSTPLSKAKAHSTTHLSLPHLEIAITSDRDLHQFFSRSWPRMAQAFREYFIFERLLGSPRRGLPEHRCGTDSQIERILKKMVDVKYLAIWDPE